MFRKLAIVVAIAVAFAALPVAAEEEVIQAKKFDSLKWYYLVHVQFEAGKAEDAMKMIRERFAPASKAAGSKMPKVFMCHTGEWDLVMLFHLTDGIADMEWEISPENVKWFAAFAEQEGGMEEAEKVLAEYQDLIEDWDAELVRWVDMTPKAEESSE
jgi:hypothetical protein